MCLLQGGRTSLEFIKRKTCVSLFADMNGEQSACYRYLYDFERQFPQAAYFYDLKYETVSGMEVKNLAEKGD